MTKRVKRIRGYLLDKDSKNIVEEGDTEIIITSSDDPNDRPTLKGTITIKGFKPHLDSNVYILTLNEAISRRVRITVRPITVPNFDPTVTVFKIWFEDSSWYSNTDWFEGL